MMRFLALLLAAFALSAPTGLRAQCADGTPPPCDVRVRQAGRPIQPAPPEVRRKSFLVLPFRNLTRSPDHEWLVDGSVTMLTDGLGRWQEITVVREGVLYPALRRHGVVAGEVVDDQIVSRIATETRGWTAVNGTVLATGGTVRISARATDVVTGREVASVDVEVSPEEDIRDTYARLALGLLGPSDHAVRQDWVSARATTQSLEAYKAYLRGLVLFSRVDVSGALAALREAVVLDSTFALAYAAIAMAWGAEAVLFDNPEALAALAAPGSEANRAIQRAATLSTRLPPRERQLLRGVSAAFQMRFGDARQALEDLLAADSTDDLMGIMAMLEMFDPVMIQTNGAEHRRGSLNEAARLIKRMVYVNPARHDAYLVLVRIFRETAGYWVGWSAGYRRELASLLDYAMSPADLHFVGLLRDTIRLLQVYPIDSLGLTPWDTVDAALSRARRVARGWVDQWIAAAPDDARAHQWVSQMLELEGDPEGALDAAARAESLSTTSPRDDLRARRMVLLGKTGRHDEAATLLDSLWSGGYLPGIRRRLLFPRDGFVALGWTVGLSAHRGDVGRADSAFALFDRLIPGTVRRGLDAVAAAALSGALPRPSRHWWALSAAELPKPFLADVLDSLLQRADRLARASALLEAMPHLLRGTADGLPREGRLRLAAGAMDAATALAALEREDAAFELASFALDVDPELRDRVAEAGWFVQRRRG